jgi:hypothetical protein
MDPRNLYTPVEEPYKISLKRYEFERKDYESENKKGALVCDTSKVESNKLKLINLKIGMSVSFFRYVRDLYGTRNISAPRIINQFSTNTSLSFFYNCPRNFLVDLFYFTHISNHLIILYVLTHNGLPFVLFQICRDGRILASIHH